MPFHSPELKGSDMPAKKEKATATKTRETTFTCKFCEKTRPLSEMTVVTRFFPAAIACRECARKRR